MKAYNIKIKQLQKEIEEKAKELGKVSYALEEAKKTRLLIGSQLTDVEKEVAEAKKVLKSLGGKITVEDARLLRSITKPKGKLQKLDEQIIYVESVLQEKEIALHDIEDLESSIVVLEKTKTELAKDVVYEFQKVALAREQAVAAEKRLQKVEESVEKELAKVAKAQDIHERSVEGYKEWQKGLKFYAQRLYRVYQRKGMQFPKELLEGMRPLKYFPSRSLAERLKIKKSLIK